MLNLPLVHRLGVRFRRAVSSLAFFALAAVVQGCGTTALEPWHTERLTAEFSVGRANEIRNFEDYKHLEEELFQQLDEEVYARVETWPEYELVRYSSGSAADPHGRSPNWNRSFEMPADDPIGGVLLLHGLTDAPYTLRVLGQALNKRNYRVLG